MRVELRMLIAIIACIAAATAARADTATTTASSASAQSSQPAVWIPQKLHIVFPPLTGPVSCDLSADAFKSALIQLGARRDGLNVDEKVCYAGPPNLEPTMDVTFASLIPAGSAGKTAGGELVEARWQTVQIVFNAITPGLRQVLLQLVRQQILPLFPNQGVKTYEDGGLRVTVLKPLKR
jgi:hypothetical protein